MLLGLLCLYYNVTLSQFSPSILNYTVDNGLPSSETHDILRDSKGYIWIATDRGVARYNGYDFERFTTNDGLTDNTIFEMVEDSKQRIWFFTMSLELCLYEDGTFKPYEYNDLLSQALIEHNLSSISSMNYYVDSLDNVYISLKGSSVKIDSSGQVSIQSLFQSSHDAIFQVKYIEKKLIDFYYYSGKSKKEFEVYYENKPTHHTIKNKENAASRIFHIEQSFAPKTGKIFFSYKDSLYTLDTLSLTINSVAYNKNSFNCIVRIKDEIWTGSYHSGISIYDLNGNFKRSLIADQSISEIYPIGNQVWITSISNGVYYIPDYRIGQLATEKTIASSWITDITLNNDTIFIGHESGQISIYKSLNKLHHLKFSARINQLEYDTTHNLLWIASPVFLNSLDRNFTLTKYTSSDLGIRALLLFNDTIVTSSSNIKYYQFHEKGKPLTFLFQSSNKSSGKSDFLQSLYRDKNTIWSGGIFGLSKTTIGLHFHDLENLGRSIQPLKNRVTCIAQKDSTLWLGTRGNSILLFDKREQVSFIDAKVGFKPKNINDIIIDGEKVWVASNMGVTLITLNYPGQYLFHQINTSSGLSTNEVTSLALYGDTLLIGTKKGLNVINTKTYQLSDTKEKPILTAVRIDEQMVDTNNIEITYDKSLIDFSFLSFDYGAGGNITYQYQIPEFDDNWYTTNERSVRFMALPPGKYTFKVRALKNDGIWTNANTLSFTVLPAIWQTWYFWGAIGFSFILLVSLIAYSLIKSANEKNEMNSRIEALKQSSLSSQMNPHFVFNVLNSILTFLLTNSQRNAAKYLSSFAWLMRKTFNLSKESKITLEEELDVLTSYFKLEKLRIDEKVDFQLHVDPELDTEALMIPPLILQPFVENAILHGLSHDRKSLISVSISKEGDCMKVVIEDNGIGIEQSKKDKDEYANAKYHQSSGLEISQERITLLHNGENGKSHLEIIDLKNLSNFTATGTRVTFYMPLSYG